MTERDDYAQQRLLARHITLTVLMQGTSIRAQRTSNIFHIQRPTFNKKIIGIKITGKYKNILSQLIEQFKWRQLLESTGFLNRNKEKEKIWFVKVYLKYSTSAFLPGKPHGQRNLAGSSPQSHRRVRCGLVTKQQEEANNI